MISLVKPQYFILLLSKSFLSVHRPCVFCFPRGADDTRYYELHDDYLIDSRNASGSLIHRLFIEHGRLRFPIVKEVNQQSSCTYFLKVKDPKQQLQRGS